MKNSKKQLLNRQQRSICLKDDLSYLEVDVAKIVKDYMIKEAFNTFDDDNSGDIDKNEFRKAITTLGLEVDDKKIMEMMRQMDKNGSGSIDFEEFKAMMSKYQFSKDSPIPQHLESSFNLYDKDSDGYISVKDLQKVWEDFTGVSNVEDAELILSMCKHFAKTNNIKANDKPGISKEEFMNFLLCIRFIEEIKPDAKTTEFSSPNKEFSETTQNREKTTSINNNINI
jgi:Ca2+-binding EF-hand superfamily protein